MLFYFEQHFTKFCEIVFYLDTFERNDICLDWYMDIRTFNNDVRTRTCIYAILFEKFGKAWSNYVGQADDLVVIAVMY